MKSVAFLGPEGTFSGILAMKRLGAQWERHAVPTIEAVFEAVLSNTCALGIVPVENSSGGTVYDTVDLLIRHRGSVFVREELSLDIRIALLGRPGVAPRTVYSHFTQIKHHSDWIRQRHPKARMVPVSSTAVAAAKAAANSHAAALASPGAAAIYGLEVLEMPKAAEEVNVTNFFLIASEAAVPKREDRTALVAELRNECGSLHTFLGPFARERVSLSRIVSRPVPGRPQTYVFYVEIEGGPGEASVARALGRAEDTTRSLVSLGTFPVGKRHGS